MFGCGLNRVSTLFTVLKHSNLLFDYVQSVGSSGNWTLSQPKTLCPSTRVSNVVSNINPESENILVEYNIYLPCFY